MSERRDEFGCLQPKQARKWGQFSVGLPQKALEALDQLAKAAGVSRAEYVRRLIAARLKEVVE